MNTKTKIALISAFAGLLLGVIIARAATPSTTFWVTPGNYPGAPTYTIWREGSNYFAKNALGQIAFDDTNCSELFDNCIGSGNVEIYVREGTYIIDTEIYPEDNTIIVGTGWNTQIFGTGNGDLFHLDNVDNITLRDMYLDGESLTGTGGKGVFGENINGLTISGLYVYKTPFTGIGVDNITHAWIVNNVVDSPARLSDGNGIGIGGSIQGQDIVFIRNNIVKNLARFGATFGFGIWLEQIGSAVDIQHIIVEGNTIFNCTEGIGSSGAYRFSIVNNQMFNCSRGLRLKNISSTDGPPIDILINGNEIFDCTDGMRIEHLLGHNVMISNNVVGDNSQHGIFLRDVDNCTVTGNHARENVNGIYLYSCQNISVTNNRIFDNSAQGLLLANNTDGGFYAINYCYRIRLDHTAATCDHNRFFGNVVESLTQTAGAPSGNTYVDNYPDNTP